MSKLCCECGKRDMEYANVKGKDWFSGEHNTSVTILTDLYLQTCPHCGNIAIRSDELIKIDEAIRDSIKLTKGENL